MLSECSVEELCRLTLAQQLRLNEDISKGGDMSVKKQTFEFSELNELSPTSGDRLHEIALYNRQRKPIARLIVRHPNVEDRTRLLFVGMVDKEVIWALLETETSSEVLRKMRDIPTHKVYCKARKEAIKRAEERERLSDAKES